MMAPISNSCQFVARDVGPPFAAMLKGLLCGRPLIIWGVMGSVGKQMVSLFQAAEEGYSYEESPNPTPLTQTRLHDDAFRQTSGDMLRFGAGRRGGAFLCKRG